MRPYVRVDSEKKEAERQLVSYAKSQFEERLKNPDDYYVNLDTISNKVKSIMPNVDHRSKAFDDLLSGIQQAIMTDYVERNYLLAFGYLR